MDSITQAALGGVVGELTLGRKLGWKGMAWGLFFGTLPDLDILAYPFLDEIGRLKWHRGISHSILMMVVASFVLARPLARLHRDKGVSVRRAGWFVFFVWSTHVLIDVFTTYGTQIFEPFSDHRVAWNNLFIIDFFFTAPLVVCILAWPLRAFRYQWDRRQWRREGADPDDEPEFQEFSLRPAKTAVLLSSVYVLFSFVMKFWAIHQLEDRMSEAIPDGELVSVSPTPLNTILWRGLIETEGGYFVTHWSPFDDAPSGYYFMAKNHELVAEFEDQELFKALKWFSRDHWVARESRDGRVSFIDMRFGEARDFEKNELLAMFRWQLDRDEEGGMTAAMAPRAKLDVQRSLGAIWSRLLGNRKEWEETKAF
jgi:inner membrane protein